MSLILISKKQTNKQKSNKKTNQNYLVLKYNMEKYIKVLQMVIICLGWVQSYQLK